jgi:hypothetical protein
MPLLLYLLKFTCVPQCKAIRERVKNVTTVRYVCPPPTQPFERTRQHHQNGQSEVRMEERGKRGECVGHSGTRRVLGGLTATEIDKGTVETGPGAAKKHKDQATSMFEPTLAVAAQAIGSIDAILRDKVEARRAEPPLISSGVWGDDPALTSTIAEIRNTSKVRSA